MELLPQCRAFFLKSWSDIFSLISAQEGGTIHLFACVMNMYTGNISLEYSPITGHYWAQRCQCPMED